MSKYYIIVSNDDNTVYKVIPCDTFTQVRNSIRYWVDSAFIVSVVNGDCMKYADAALVKKARKKAI